MALCCLAWPGDQSFQKQLSWQGYLQCQCEAGVCAIYSLFEIVTLLLQSGFVFADRQQLRLSLLKAAWQLINDLQQIHNVFLFENSSCTEKPKKGKNLQKAVRRAVFKDTVRALLLPSSYSITNSGTQSTKCFFGQQGYTMIWKYDMTAYRTCLLLFCILCKVMQIQISF